MLNTVADYDQMDEAGLVEYARRGDREAFRTIMTRCNQRLFRLARGVIGNDVDAEDVVQEAYLKAFAAIGGFRGDAGFYTWLSAITLNEARSRLRRTRAHVDLTTLDNVTNVTVFPTTQPAMPSPESDAARAEIRQFLQRAIDDVPTDFRLVFMLRDVEGCSVEETAEILDIKPGTVKTRHFRARSLLRAALDKKLATALHGTFPFLGERCAAITRKVLDRFPF